MARRLLRRAARALRAAVLVSIALVVAFRWIDPPVTPLMIIRVVQSAAAGEPRWIHRSWVSLSEVSPELLRAVIAGEDARFFEHRGFDVREIELAWRSNERGRRLRGASTITMQCARNVFLWPGRTWIRKALEAWFTVLLEVFWTKPRILEVYVNVAEWGDGVYGAQGAALRWFRVRASRLSPRQAALLAAALPSPLRSEPGDPSPYLRARAARIARLAGAIDLGPLGGPFGSSTTASSADRRARGGR